jgi:hypothetical protein
LILGVPTLDLDFAATPLLDSRIAFSRGTNATLIDSTGQLTFAPNNLVLQSLDATNAVWGTANTTVTGGVADPVGGTNAQTVTATAAAGQLFQFISIPSAASTRYLTTIWVRRRTGSGAIILFAPDATNTTIAVTSTWTRFFVSGNGGSGFIYPGILISNSGDQVDIYFPTCSAVSYETTPRAADLVATTATAYYGPRFDYDPVTLAPRGLLVEEGRTSLLLNSLLSGANLATQSVTVSATPHTLSFYGTGTITLTGAHSATVTGTGAYPARRTLTFTPSVGPLLLTVSGTVQFAQLEVGSFATSFIPTGGVIATRNADAATMTGANFSSWYNQNEGTFVVEGSTLTAVNAAIPAFLAVSDGTNANYSAIFADNTLGRPQFVGFVGSAPQFDLSNPPFAITANVPFSSAAAYKINDFAMSTNGSAVATDALGTLPTVNVFGIGNRHGNSRFLNGHIRAIKYFNRRLANTQLQVLST